MFYWKLTDMVCPIAFFTEPSHSDRIILFRMRIDTKPARRAAIYARCVLNFACFQNATMPPGRAVPPIARTARRTIHLPDSIIVPSVQWTVNETVLVFQSDPLAYLFPLSCCTIEVDTHKPATTFERAIAYARHSFAIVC